MLGALWILESEKYASESDAETSAKAIEGQGYQTIVVGPKYKKEIRVGRVRDRDKSRAEAVTQEYKDMGWKARTAEYKRGAWPMEYKVWETRAQEPYWQVKKKKLAEPELTERAKAKEVEVRIVEAEAAKAQAESPLGQLVAFFINLFKPVDLTQYAPQLPDLPELPQIPAMSGPRRVQRYGSLSSEEEYGDELI